VVWIERKKNGVICDPDTGRGWQRGMKRAAPKKDNQELTMSFAQTLSLESGLSLACIAFPWLFRQANATTGLLLAIGGGLVWIVFFVVAVAKYKRRSLWILVSAPLALYWIAAVFALVVHGGPT
jgi:hypothetical protein